MQGNPAQAKSNTPSDTLNAALWDEDIDTARRLARSLPAEALDKPDNFDCLPMTLAVLRGHLDIVGILLDRGVSPETREASGKTPMDWAVTQQNEYALEMMKTSVEDRRRRAAEAFRAAAEAKKEDVLYSAAENVQDNLRGKAGKRPKVRFKP